MSLFDENAGVLRELESRGNDLSSPHSVDFEHIFLDNTSAQEFAEASSGEGFEVKIWEINHETHPWNVTASRVMMPTCENITQTEEHLSALAHRYGGRPDGWGFFST